MRMITPIKQESGNLAECAPRPVGPSPALNPTHVGSLCSLMEIYESEAPDEEESEVDLMIQLSGMVYNDARGGE